MIPSMASSRTYIGPVYYDSQQPVTKRVIWSDETKINFLGSDGCKWVWKRPGEGLNDRLIKGTVKFKEG